MFDIAFSELVVIGLIALVVLGPNRLQQAARTAGRWMARVRRFVDDVKRDMDAEMRRGELDELRNVQQQLVETKQIIEQGATGALAGLASIQHSEPAADPVLAPRPDAPAPPAARAPAKPKKKTARRTKTAPPKRAAHGRATRKSR